MGVIAGVVSFALVVLFLIIAVVIISYFRLWLRAWLSQASVGWLQLVGMSLRKVNPAIIVDSRIMAVKAGLNISTN